MSCKALFLTGVQSGRVRTLQQQTMQIKHDRSAENGKGKEVT